ncbi:MAG TPA: hypothetical protein VLA58_03035, partial [Chitinophagaceae bacterium]|nr:hypothetical protein [Chitinophagaceae bacterium]
MKCNLTCIPLLVASFVVFSCGSPKENDTGTTPAEAAKTVDTPKVTSARPAHWGYEGEDGPDKWSALSAAYNL